jgi:hypothetical protein
MSSKKKPSTYVVVDVHELLAEGDNEASIQKQMYDNADVYDMVDGQTWKFPLYKLVGEVEMQRPPITTKFVVKK